MGAAHSADGNLSSFFLRSSKGVPPAAQISSSGSALTEQQQFFCACVRTCFIAALLQLHSPCIFSWVRSPSILVFPRSNGSCLAVSVGCVNKPVRANSSLFGHFKVLQIAFKCCAQVWCPLTQVFKQSGSWTHRSGCVPGVDKKLILSTPGYPDVVSSDLQPSWCCCGLLSLSSIFHGVSQIVTAIQECVLLLARNFNWLFLYMMCEEMEIIDQSIILYFFFSLLTVPSTTTTSPAFLLPASITCQRSGLCEYNLLMLWYNPDAVSQFFDYLSSVIISFQSLRLPQGPRWLQGWGAPGEPR